jgi:hypothetical protein
MSKSQHQSLYIGRRWKVEEDKEESLFIVQRRFQKLKLFTVDKVKRKRSGKDVAWIKILKVRRAGLQADSWIGSGSAWEHIGHLQNAGPSITELPPNMLTQH